MGKKSAACWRNDKNSRDSTLKDFRIGSELMLLGQIPPPFLFGFLPNICYAGTASSFAG